MSAPLNWHKWLVLSLLGLALSAQPIGCDYSSITEKFGAEAVARCNEKCPFQNRTGDGHFDVSCGSECSVEQCTLGCNLWPDAIENSCQTVCNVTSETVFSRELYCVMGCNEALNTYFQKLKELMGTPPAPALVADSLTATSLSLVWEAPNLYNISYLVQWRYEEPPGTWQYYSNSSHSHRSIIHVENLKPYTKYRFRVAIFLSGRVGTGEPVYSAPSVVISTMESGTPTSAPVALRAVAPDPSRVAISWEPGPFPNGPLISFVLRLTDKQPNTVDALEDMPASNNTLFYMFQNLAPATEYEVSVAMRNVVGEGPAACVNISTPPLPTSVPTPQPILILGGEHKILAAMANDMLSDPVELYSTEHEIMGVGLDVTSDSLFVSVSNGYVYRTFFTKRSVSEPILTPKMISYQPLDISVDWLNRHLYILAEVNHTTESTNTTNGSTYSNWEILRYDFDGKNQVVALSGYFHSRPIHFEVDAYNGYLFWALRGTSTGGGGGLYRLDLASISNGVRHTAPPELIVRDSHLGAFTVDHADFRILVAHLKRNTVLAVSLDGHEITDFRSNTQKPMFLSTRSIAYANGLFYWTNGKETLTEEYHAQSDNYFHNEYPLAYNNKILVTRQVLVALRACQPIPIPVNPPIEVQSVMGINRAKVSWSPPHLLGHQGSGAWQQWTFHLQLTHNGTGETIDRKNITETMLVVENLEQNAEYIIRVAAVTKSGSGPWSSEFVGKTLASTPTTLHSTLLWSGPDGLLQTDLTGENLQTLIHRTDLKDVHITDISWYQDKLYLVTNASTVMWYNTTSNEKAFMSNMENVGSLAVDWVGKKIYWSNPKQQLITRGNFDGTNREPVPIVTVAKELTIDSLSAYIYWNTGHAVEAARLNGENKMVYYPAQLFSGKQVMGLTTDLEEKWLYWLVRSYENSELHRAPTADKISGGLNEISGSLVARLPGSASLGPLCYFAGRLAWVQDAARAVVSDLQGRYTATLVPRVQVIAVRDPTLHADSESLIAIPEPVDASSITVSGTAQRFNVSWAPRHVTVNNSRVYYDVSLQFPGLRKIESTVDEPWVTIDAVNSSWGYPAGVAPYSALEVRVRAHSAWGGGPAARAARRSPMARPTKPTRARLYVQRANSDGPMTAIFRWEPPARSNGIIRGYEVQCWTNPTPHGPAGPARPSACADARLGPQHTQLMLRDLTNSSTYHFKVRAYTDAGFGEHSETVESSSDEVNPIPKVMLSSQESIKIIDLDSGDSEIIPKSTGIPIDFAVSIEENIVYWVNNLDEIFSSRINGSGHYKLATNNGTATSICVDWVGRAVYWTQLELPGAGSASAGGSAAYATRLAGGARPPLARLFVRKQPMYSLQVMPLRRSLFWYEESTHPGLGTLYTSKLDGSQLQTFFNQTGDGDDLHNCTCPENPQVAKAFVIDMTTKETELYWVDPWMNHIKAADMRGCMCRIVVDATEKKKHGFIPMSITVDSKYIYWFNSTEKAIFYTTKNRKGKIEQIKISYGYKIMALDPGNQRYPPKECLYPVSHYFQPKFTSNSANTLSFHLPHVNKPQQCQRLEYEMAATEYTIYYKVHDAKDSTSCDKETCPYITTTKKDVTLNELKPFTQYTVSLEATNYYAKLHEVKPIVGASLVLQTAAEAPTAPQNVKYTVLSPVLARVEWKAVKGLWYELHWRTIDNPLLPHRLNEHTTFQVSSGRSANMSRLAPATAYAVWVRARSDHSALSADSPSLTLRTLPLPAPVALKNATADQLTVLWPPPTSYYVHRYNVEYIESLHPTQWSLCVQGDAGEWIAKDLEPKTSYRFRLRLQYVVDGPLFHWPDNDTFTYETLCSVPGPPGAVRVSAVGAAAGPRVARVWWPDAAPRGAPVTHYRVWGRPQHRTNYVPENATQNISELLPANLPRDLDDEMKRLIITEGWELLYNGTDAYWLIGSEELSLGYYARAQAYNVAGWGPPGPAAALGAPLHRPRPPPAPAALAAALAALAALVIGVAAAVFYTYNNRSKKKAALAEALAGAALRPARRGPDVELATLRQLPIRHSTNILYNQGVHCPTDAELASLPHIRREQITLTKFLGSGAFGEVFEGVVRQINGTTAETKVAVKTLRKGATEQEKTEFLKEAALMSNFKHEHILRLVGVCLDNDPDYILMELMEGGDLLSYLRAKRVSLYTPESLTLLDLLNMCVDVTKGCRYLEEMHFVHRDLACRNCLVAHRGNTRVVKIGDFGLARDIYKNDYYRKEGEGLLPVRWMAVECLVDGVFSCQSDVWAWAVLCWEVLSLGQQPYPMRTNRQVLQYVRAGGAPDRPPNCPNALYELLRQCWSYRPEARPSFRRCLSVAAALRDKTSPNITLTATPAPPPQYLTLLADDAVDNRTYLLDENDNALDEDFPEQQMEPSRLLPQRTKYLELMYGGGDDSVASDICVEGWGYDGYEVPRGAAFAPFSRHSIVGVAPNRLVRAPLPRSRSLRAPRPPRATITPLRSRATLPPAPLADPHVFKTPF